MNYFGISHTCREVLALDQWLRRRVRCCRWKQWQRPHTRRRHLIALGIHPSEVKKASRCRRGYWWMSSNGIVQRALNNAWLWEQGVPDLKAQWIELHYGGRPAPLMDMASLNLTGTAGRGPACHASPAVALPKADGVGAERSMPSATQLSDGFICSGLKSFH